MIGIIFQQGTEIIEIRIDGKVLLFRLKKEGNHFVTIDNLKLSREGCIKEHPDLKDNPNWRRITIKRFKDKINSYEKEIDKLAYLIEDLKQFGFIPLYYQRQGHRPIKLIL